VEYAAQGGVEYICLDMQHGLCGFESLAGEIGACWDGGAAALVRTASSDAWQIGKALDLGAAGVIVPQVSNREAAARAVAACRYPPEGERSYGPIRRQMDLDETHATGHDPLCFVMVETREGLERVAEIASTPGVTGIYIGVSDLALALGLTARGSSGNREHADALERIRTACEEAGVIAGMHCHNGREAKERAAQGFQLITIASDLTLLRGTVARELAEAVG